MTTKLFNTLAAATTLAGIVATSGAANAASLSYTSSTNYDFTNIIDAPLSVQKFNSSLGTLKGVTISFTGDILGDAGFENKSPTPTQVTVNLASQLSLKLNNQSLFALNPQDISSYQAAKYDGKTDYSGTSGKTISNLTATQSATQSFTNTQFLQSLTGNGDIDFLFSALANSVVTGSGNMRSYIDTYAKAGIKVTYDYDAKAVPESSATLGIGLIAGLCLLSQRKKSWIKMFN
ncbi:PEP-CTERM sorting domain-containing protein [Nostoc sp. 'Peltigera membranacea cyanobiont' 210A]|uniref:choice-of-anchor E domain-containing protein n=1 Tax=Nostoc sp. 'Peltigera membranacea cyanobiont' 210A TaxID=2014529 RepID=UPI000B951434|nr:choice-of-anchor E domain-containing protein [Nostoc sp. 'Peltigera membranacea cyanobiont' 210A]OYD98061.1 PEP-CTERM sorting domain-containing protein [Nostoc sp. 'Peltigera membranacea cyanobiont' 210A]